MHIEREDRGERRSNAERVDEIGHSPSTNYGHFALRTAGTETPTCFATGLRRVPLEV